MIRKTVSVRLLAALLAILLGLFVSTVAVDRNVNAAGAPEPTSETAATEAADEPSRFREGYSPLSGLKVSEDYDGGRIYAVSIDNTPPARWHAGLLHAELVIEFLNEAKSSRFVAFFMTQTGRPPADADQEGETAAEETVAETPELPTWQIGPIRSVRPFMVERAIEYDAIIAHCGGSTDGITAVENFGIDNLDAIYLPTDLFWRYNDTGKEAPHNLYTHLKAMKEYSEFFEMRLKYDESKFKGYLFSEDVRPLGGEKATEIEIRLAPFNVKTYRYQDDERTYERYDNGELHLDENENKPLAPVNILVQEAMSHVYDDAGHVAMAQIGEGKALYFSHGEVIPLTWEKPDAFAMTVFRTEDGKELVFNPGQMFLQVVDSLEDVEILSTEPLETSAE